MNKQAKVSKQKRIDAMLKALDPARGVQVKLGDEDSDMVRHVEFFPTGSSMKNRGIGLTVARLSNGRLILSVNVVGPEGNNSQLTLVNRDYKSPGDSWVFRLDPPSPPPPKACCKCGAPLPFPQCEGDERCHRCSGDAVEEVIREVIEGLK